MSPVFDVLSSLMHVLHPQAPAALVPVGFSVLLVAWLVAVEERELRRDGGPPG